MTGSRALGALVRPVAVPVACAALLTGLLSAWVATGGGGTLRRLPFTFELAAVSSPAATAGVPDAATYLVIKNLAGRDELLSAQAPVSRRIVLARRGSEFSGTGPHDAAGTLPALAIPARSTTSLSPLGADIVLIAPGALQVGATVPVTLTFRHAGRITVDFTVTAAGTP
jgi:copper(I)-binding protein